MTTPSSTLAVATQFLQSGEQRYAYRRFGEAPVSRCSSFSTSQARSTTGTPQ